MKPIMTSGALMAIVCLWAGAAAAADKPMEGFFGNTMICKGPTWECHEWFNADGTFVMFGVKHENGIEIASNFREGKWYVNDEGLLCRQMNTPPSPPPAAANAPAAGAAAPAAAAPAGPNCGGPGHRTAESNLYKAGHKWEDVNRTGQAEHFEIVAGHR